VLFIVECDKSGCWFKDDTISIMSSTMNTRVGDNLQSVDGGWENIEAPRPLSEALELEGDRCPSGHAKSGNWRSYEVEQLILKKIQTLVDGMDGTRDCFKRMANSIQKKTKMVTNKEVLGYYALEEESHPIWAKSQRLHDKKKGSPSRFLFDVGVILPAPP